MINSFLQKLSTWVTAKSNISTRIDFLLLTNVTFLRAITMCSVTDCAGMTKALFFSLGTCIVQPQSVRVNFASTKRLFNLSAGAIINVRSACLCVKCAIFLLKIKQILFFLSLGSGVYIFEENRKSIQDVIGDVYCPGKYCCNREKCLSIGGYVTTPRSLYGCDNCGAWWFVH